MKQTIIPAGFQLTVKSWENDASARRTITKGGYDYDTVSFLVDYVKLFYSENNHTNKGFGNMCDHTYEVDEAVQALVAKHNNLAKVQEEVKQYFFDEDGTAYTEDLNELHYEFFGSSEYYFTRVLDSFKVEYIPEDIVLEDVTEQFKEKA